ncbi:MAG: hypothetical protein DRH26_16315, partial [Deltaproteobacteria bacterium]
MHIFNEKFSRTICFFAMFLLIFTVGAGAATISTQNGWNLLSSRIAITVADADKFSNADNFASVWKWESDSNSWAVYLPGQDEGGATYAEAKGFAELMTISPGEGFWVNSTGIQSVTLTDTEVDLDTISLTQGWNLKGSKTDSSINVGSIFSDSTKFASVWKWVGSKWAVYLPGETTSGAYAGSHGFDVLSSIAPGEGFWVNYVDEIPLSLDVLTMEQKNKAAADTIMEYAVKEEIIKYDAFEILSQGYTNPMFDSENDLSDQPVDELALKIEELIAMQADLDAALQQLGMGSTVAPAKSMALLYSENVLKKKTFGSKLANFTGWGSTSRENIIKTVNWMIDQDVTDQNGKKEYEFVWDAIKGTNYQYGANDLNEWLAKLKNGDMDVKTYWIHKHLTDTVENSDETPVYNSSASLNYAGKNHVAHMVGVQAINTTKDIIVEVVKYIPPAKGVTMAFDYADKAGKYYDYAKNILNGDTGAIKDQVISDITSNNILGKIPGGSLVSTFFPDVVKNTSNYIFNAKPKTGSLDDVVSLTNNINDPQLSVGAGAVHIKDYAAKTEVLSGDDEPSSSLVVFEEATGSVPDILGIMPDVLYDDEDFEDDDFTFWVPEGDWDLTMVDSDGNIETTPDDNPVITINEQLAVKKVETAPADVVYSISCTPLNYSPEIDEEVTVSCTATNLIPMFSVTATPMTNAILSYGATSSDNQILFDSGNEAFEFLFVSAVAGSHSVIVGVTDSLGNEADTTVLLTTIEPAVQITKAIYGATDTFITDEGTDDEIFWILNIVATFNPDGTLSIDVTGTANGSDVSGTFTGSWGGGTFSA